MVRLGGGSDSFGGCRRFSCRPAGGVVRSGCDDGEIADGDGLVAVRAVPAGPDAPAKGSAVVAALPAEVAGLAGRALVHGALSRGPRRDGELGGGRRAGGGGGAPGGLPASVRAPPA